LLAESALILKAEKEAAMRQALSIAVVATLLIATAVEIVAAGANTVAKNHFYYAAPASGVGMAIPRSTKGFPAELLPE
jgi:hypothetical protein